MTTDPITLVSDVGGTNTRVALTRGATVLTDTVSRYRNADHDGLGAVFSRFLGEQGEPAVRGACIAMAGPVLDGVGSLTNLGWSFDRERLQDATGAGTTAILNDLQAQGHALDHLGEGSVYRIVPGPEGDVHNAQLCVGVGTGFNAVPVFRTETGRYVPPCEAGHTTLPVISDADFDLARHVSVHHGFPGVEDVLSGRGLERIYDWASGGEHLSSAEIMEAAEAGDTVAEQTLEAFVQSLGRVTGDLALTHLPFGGIYLVGGMANAMRPYFARFGFDEAFRAKGRFSEFMSRFAVFGVEDDYAALTGCARHLNGLIRSGH